MCGISGIVEFDGKVNLKELNNIRDTLIHRGPDNGNSFINKSGNVGLGHRRLSIIDLSESANQPMFNEDKSIGIVYNGEIYNYIFLREELKKCGHIFKSNSDTEVIIHGYEEWGMNVLHKLRGMFSFSIWDENTNCLFAARDRLGIKPYVYFIDDKRFIFASEIKAILRYSKIPSVTDKTSIYDFFTYNYIPAPKTLYKNIYKLEAGHYLTLKDNKLEIQKYWDIDFTPDLKMNEQEAIINLNNLIRESIRLRLISDVPLGVFLSGGVDSSVITMNMRQERNNGEIKSYFIGYDSEYNDETEDSKFIAKLFNTSHHEKIINRNIIEETINKVFKSLDEPLGDNSIIPTYLVSEFSKKQITVALSGDGGDEAFGGYNWYPESINFYKYNNSLESFKILKKFIRLIDSVYPNIKGKAKLKKLSSDFFEFYSYKLSGIPSEIKNKIYCRSFIKDFEGYDTFWLYKKYWDNDFDLWSKMQYLDIKTFLCDDILTKVDKASMLNSQEVRVPLLDHKLLEFVASVPFNVRNKNYSCKYLLKKSLEGRLPDRILKKKKIGFIIQEFYKFFQSDFLSLNEFDSLSDIINVKKMLNKSNNDYLWKTYCLKKILG